MIYAKLGKAELTMEFCIRKVVMKQRKKGNSLSVPSKLCSRENKANRDIVEYVSEYMSTPTLGLLFKIDRTQC